MKRTVLLVSASVVLAVLVAVTFAQTRTRPHQQHHTGVIAVAQSDAQPSFSHVTTQVGESVSADAVPVQHSLSISGSSGLGTRIEELEALVEQLQEQAKATPDLPAIQVTIERLQEQIKRDRQPDAMNYVRPHVSVHEVPPAVEADQTLRQWKAATSESEREQIKAKLRAVLEQEFQQRLEQHEQEIQRLEEKVQQLRDQLEKRRAKQEEIVGFRLEQLLREAQGLGWGTEATGPAGHANEYHLNVLEHRSEPVLTGRSISMPIPAGPPAPPAPPSSNLRPPRTE